MKIYFIIIILLLTATLWSGDHIKLDRVPDEMELIYALKDSIAALQEVYDLRDAGQTKEALDKLTSFLKEKSSDRYYFDWHFFRERFSQYLHEYPDKQEDHLKLARDQMDRFAPETKWILPFKNLRGDEVTAYELRHLARQQKSFDMALTYYYENEKRVYLDYFVKQVADLNRAFAEDAYDDAGNGIYEVYRGGRRIQNWLFCHHAFLASPAYNPEEQRLLIRTFLHHGAQLYKRSKKMRYGNHHTRGLVALFEIAVLFPEFSGTDIWLRHAINGLVWHLTNEVNPDGFQFERSVHYHKGDVDNYFRVFQLARINNIPLPEIYEQQFRKLFESLVKLAQPNRRLPVLQDDTDKPFAENNAMDEVMILGTIVFNDPVFKYFSGDRINAEVYWLLRSVQLGATQDLKPSKPEMLSCELPETGYYIMRNGWGDDAVYLTVTAGLSEKKPDHQHGDMLGIVGYANGHEILPNYQVKYNAEDYAFFKNSWVKNVALVDNHVQGQGWQQNEGKSGFGKWKSLPQPKVISWSKMERFEHFIGTHNGFDSLDVTYYREIIYFHEGFWILVDHFESGLRHTYQQVWQGNFDDHAENIWDKQYEDGSGVKLIQLGDSDLSRRELRFREKSSTIIECCEQDNFSFLTLIVPYKNSERKSVVQSGDGKVQIGDWRITPISDRQKEGQGWVARHDAWGSIFLNTKEYHREGAHFSFEKPTNFAVSGDIIQYLGRSLQKLSSEPPIKSADLGLDQWFPTLEVRPGNLYLIKH